MSLRTYSSFDGRKSFLIPRAIKKEVVAKKNGGPDPLYYEVKYPTVSKGVIISKASRDKNNSTISPGPGYYSSVDLYNPFSGFGDFASGGSVVQPSLQRGHRLGKARRSITEQIFPTRSTHSAGVNTRKTSFVGTAQNTCSSRQEEPGPLSYHPNTKAVSAEVSTTIFSTSPRFRSAADVSFPGPGFYENILLPHRDSSAGSSFCQYKSFSEASKVRVLPTLELSLPDSCRKKTSAASRRSAGLERFCSAEYRDLRREYKYPGPGAYSPKMNRKGVEI